MSRTTSKQAENHFLRRCLSLCFPMGATQTGSVMMTRKHEPGETVKRFITRRWDRRKRKWLGGSYDEGMSSELQVAQIQEAEADGEAGLDVADMAGERELEAKASSSNRQS